MNQKAGAHKSSCEQPWGKKLITLYLWLSCIFVVCLSFVCVQEAQIARQRRTVVPSVPQNAEWEARSLFAKEVL